MKTKIFKNNREAFEKWYDYETDDLDIVKITVEYN